ncbi:GDSL lipase/esterase, partial [Dillenia turbinata]
MRDVTSPCCKTVKETGLCIRGQAEPPCHGLEMSYYFWDGFHPSQTAYSEIADSCIKNSAFCTPLSIDDLLPDGGRCVDFSSTSSVQQ